METIQLQRVSYTYGNRVVLNDISVGFATNSITCIMGRSGSGKSSLLQAILGLIRPEEGQILINNKAHTYPLSARARLRFGYMIQGNGLCPHLTVAENISLHAKLIRLKSHHIRDRVSHLLEMAGLDQSYAGKFPYQLSTSEQLRVAISRAYFLDPPVLLLDEPFASIDADARKELHLEFLKFQRAYPRTVLLVTHDVAEARLLADDILIMDSGAVQQVGNKDRVLMRPANLSVKHVLQESVTAGSDQLAQLLC